MKCDIFRLSIIFHIANTFYAKNITSFVADILDLLCCDLGAIQRRVLSNCNIRNIRKASGG